MTKGKDPDPYLWLMDPDLESHKHADPESHKHAYPDPDPQHWLYYILSIKPLKYLLLSICFLLGMFSKILVFCMETELYRISRCKLKYICQVSK